MEPSRPDRDDSTRNASNPECHMDRFQRLRWTTSRAVLLATALAAGCGKSASSNLSPTAAEDPARYERAKASTEAWLQKNRVAEQKAMRRMHANKVRP